MTSHGEIYGAAELYDLAFSYRDIGREVAFLRGIFEEHRGRRPARFLEIAAGPARHALGMAEAGIPSAGLDVSPAMARYARELALRRGVALSYTLADMRNFTLDESFELAACMLCSATYLLEDQDILSHLHAVSMCLAGGGLYVLELPHPNDADGAATTKDAWTMRAENGTLEVTWREIGGVPPADGPVIRSCLARLAFTPADGPPVIVEDRSLQRILRRPELERLVAESKCFDLEAVWGAFDQAIPLDGPAAWRMIALLRKRA